MQIQRFSEISSRFSDLTIMIVGDVMLDTYMVGNVSRISPEAPVPVIAVDNTEYKPGGAANVARNLVSMGAKAILLGVVGEDQAAIYLNKSLADDGITRQLITDASRPTTEKTRVIGGNQHIVRVDHEVTDPITDEVAEQLTSNFLASLPAVNGIIIQDYNKGTLTAKVIRKICQAAGEAAVPVFVDPKIDNMEAFTGCHLIKPNHPEAERMVGRTLKTDDDFRAAGETLRDRLKADMVLLTRGSLGMDLIDDTGYYRTPTRARNIADVCGAGDTVISSFALASLAGAEPREAAALANYAAGTVVEEMGVVSATKEKIANIILHHSNS